MLGVHARHERVGARSRGRQRAVRQLVAIQTSQRARQKDVPCGVAKIAVAPGLSLTATAFLHSASRHFAERDGKDGRARLGVE